ncbi:MAG: hypothetical protein KDD69_10620 [Bdellovibrionales bacterium]|nr:hypothetical protein [Bdellovibrionales bacterium]
MLNTPSTTTIMGFDFEGPFDYQDPWVLRSLAGVYVITDLTLFGRRWLDVGESGDVRTRVSNHDRASSWGRSAVGRISVYAHYMPFSTAEERRTREILLRVLLSPECGSY